MNQEDNIIYMGYYTNLPKGLGIKPVDCFYSRLLYKESDPNNCIILYCQNIRQVRYIDKLIEDMDNNVDFATEKVPNPLLQVDEDEFIDCLINKRDQLDISQSQLHQFAVTGTNPIGISVPDELYHMLIGPFYKLDLLKGATYRVNFSNFIERAYSSISITQDKVAQVS